MGNLTVKKAKSWYETHVNRGDNVGLRLAGSGDSTLRALKPLLDWDLATLHNDSIWSVVELPWEYENGKITIGNIEAINEAADSGVEMQQLLRLVILQNNQTGEMYGFKMAIAPDSEYIQGADLSGNNNYLSRDSNLRGLVLFYSLQDEFVNGWLYSDADTGEGALRAGNASPIEIEICASWVITVLDIEVHGQNCKTVYYLPTLDIGSDGSGGGGYNGMFGDTDGGGGSSSNNNTNPEQDTDTGEANPKEIFRNSKMTEENWKEIEKMLDKIIKNCLGKGLYNGLKNSLNGKTLPIEFIPGDDSAFNYATGKISLSMNMENDQLFHEMWHAYQAYQETQDSYKNSLLNQEIETRYAHYLYLDAIGSKKWNEWGELDKSYKSISTLKDYITPKGNLRPGQSTLSLESHILNNTVPLLKQIPAYNTPFDFGNPGLGIFKNLRKLSKNC